MGVVKHRGPLPAAHEHARAVLKNAGRTCQRIIRVDPDSILYLGASGLPMTAWLWRNEKGLDIWVEPGFAAVPNRLCPLPMEVSL